MLPKEEGGVKQRACRSFKKRHLLMSALGDGGTQLTVFNLSAHFIYFLINFFRSLVIDQLSPRVDFPLSSLSL
jgi:hypothetical protein